MEHNRIRKGVPFQDASWRKLHATDHPLQDNSYDCGVFLCYYARTVCEGEDPADSSHWLPGMVEEPYVERTMEMQCFRILLFTQM